MKIILFSIALIFPLLVVGQVGVPVEDESIIKQCITYNGSVYELELDPVTRQGNIRLRWKGQDVFYDAMIMITEYDKLTGIAQFSESMTGETKATPWIFSYNKFRNTLKDNDLQVPGK